MTTDGNSTQAAADAVKTFATAAAAQYVQYLNSPDVVFLQPDIVIPPEKP
jgi:hypothetical protein